MFIYFILDLSQLRALTHSDRPWIPMVPATSFPHPWVSKPQLGNEAKPPGSAKKLYYIALNKMKNIIKKGMGWGTNSSEVLAACVNMKPNFSAL